MIFFKKKQKSKTPKNLQGMNYLLLAPQKFSFSKTQCGCQHDGTLGTLILIPSPSLLKIPAIPQYKIDCFTVDMGWQKWTSYVFALYRVCNKHGVYPIKTSFLVAWGAIPVCSSFSVKPVGVWQVMQNIMIWQIWKIYPVIQYYTFLDSANIFKLRKYNWSGQI